MGAIQQMLLGTAPAAVAGLQFIASSSDSTTAASSSATIPAGAQIGDTVVFVITLANFAGASPVATAFGGVGYTEAVNTTFTSGTNRLMVYVKRFTSTPETTVNLTQSSGANRINTVAHLWRGVSSVQQLDVTTLTVVDVDSGPAVTPVTNGAVVLSVVGQSTATLGSGQAVPSGYSNQQVRAQSDFYSWAGATWESRTGIASKVWSGSGSETAGAWTSTASNGLARAALVLRPG